MKRLRLFLLSACLAFGVALAQHAAALHALGHAVEEVLDQDSGQPPAQCEQHSLFSSLASGLGAEAPAAPFVAMLVPAPSWQAAQEASLAPRRRFQSRAPPATPA